MTKTVLVTGSSNGFGNDVAKTLAVGGHRVFATMRRTNDRHREAAAELRTVGVETLELDVTRTLSVDAAIVAVFEKTSGKLDVLINNAGIASAGLSETFTPEQVSEMFDVNVVGLQRTLRAALPQMRNNRSGLVINIGSILGRLIIPFLGLYGGFETRRRGDDRELPLRTSQFGVDVVLVQPGPFPTKLYTAMQTPSDPDRAEQYGEVAAAPGAVAAGTQWNF